MSERLASPRRVTSPRRGRKKPISEHAEFFITNVHFEGDSTVAKVVGEVDIAGASALGDGLRGVADLGDGDLVIDLQQVSFLDLAGLDALEDICARLAAGGRTTSLRHPSRQVTRLLDLRRGWTMSDPWDVEW